MDLENLSDEVEGEVSDALAQLLLVARRFDVDPTEELERKWFRWRHLVQPEDTAGIRDVGGPV